MQHIDKLRSLARRSPLPLEIRLARLRALREEVLRREAEVKRALAADLGKCSFEAYASEIAAVLGEIKHLERDLPSLVKPRRVSTPLALQPGSSFIHPEPYGVVLVIAPWNYPVQLALAPLVGAIAAGNRVVLKPSEISAHCAPLIEQLVSSVFTSDEVLVVQGGAEETRALLEQRFDYIFFTGSTAVGRIVMQAAARHLTPVTLELGGKSPCLLDESADLVQAARRIAWGKWMNAGQTCVAPDYVLVPEALEQKFLAALKDALERFYGTDPRRSPDYGRIISQRHHGRLVALLQHAEVYHGGDADAASRYLAPTVLTKVDVGSPLMEEEIFGPLLPVIPYRDFAQAIDFINQKPKPLAFYFFSENRRRQEDVLGQVSFGGGCVNDTVLHLANSKLPFGGVGDSGLGAYHGAASFETFSHKKSVFRQTTLVDVPVRYPPYAQKEGLVKKLL